MLRVIAGTAKGHKLNTLKGDATRPTSDRVKGALFNILAPYLDHAEVLELFAGTGSLGIEALSRGANSLVCVDKSTECGNVIRKNLEHTRLSDRAEVLVTGAAEAVARLDAKGRKFDLVLMDPPYRKNLVEETLKILAKNDIISHNGIVAAETCIQDHVPEEIGNLKLKRSQRYGETVLSFYLAASEALSE